MNIIIIIAIITLTITLILCAITIGIAIINTEGVERKKIITTFALAASLILMLISFIIKDEIKNNIKRNKYEKIILYNKCGMPIDTIITLKN